MLKRYKNADNRHTDLEQYIEKYQFLKEKNITSLSKLKESISTFIRLQELSKTPKRKLIIKQNLLTKQRNI